MWKKEKREKKITKPSNLPHHRPSKAQTVRETAFLGRRVAVVDCGVNIVVELYGVWGGKTKSIDRPVINVSGACCQKKENKNRQWGSSQEKKKRRETSNQVLCSSQSVN